MGVAPFGYDFYGEIAVRDNSYEVQTVVVRHDGHRANIFSFHDLRCHGGRIGGHTAGRVGGHDISAGHRHCSFTPEDTRGQHSVSAAVLLSALKPYTMTVTGSLYKITKVHGAAGC